MNTDAFENEIKVGDIVAYVNECGYFELGKIIRLTKYFVIINPGKKYNVPHGPIKKCKAKVLKPYGDNIYYESNKKYLNL